MLRSQVSVTALLGQSAGQTETRPVGLLVFSGLVAAVVQRPLSDLRLAAIPALVVVLARLAPRDHIRPPSILVTVLSVTGLHLGALAVFALVLQPLDS